MTFDGAHGCRNLVGLALLAWMLAAPSIAHSKPCKGLWTEEDPVDGNVQAAVTVAPARYWGLEIYHHTLPTSENPEWQVLYQMHKPGNSREILPTGHTLHLVLEDGTKLAFTAFVESLPNAQAWATSTAGGVYSSWVGKYTATPEDAAHLAASPITVIQVRVDDVVFSSLKMEDQTAPFRKNVRKFPALVQCFVEATASE